MTRKSVLLGKIVLHPDTLVRLENTASRAVAALGLKEHDGERESGFKPLQWR
jgi:hypothetical protein